MRLLVVFFCIVQISIGQNISFNKGQTTTSNYYSEIIYKSVKGKIIIPVKFKGKTYQFLLDTGAPNLITSNIKKHLGQRDTKLISVSDANNNKNKMELVTMPVITIGDIEFKNQTALV